MSCDLKFVAAGADRPLHLYPVILLQILQVPRHGTFWSRVNPKKYFTTAVVEENRSITPNLPLAANERAQLQTVSM
jgi:hypothetical protein